MACEREMGLKTETDNYSWLIKIEQDEWRIFSHHPNRVHFMVPQVFAVKIICTQSIAILTVDEKFGTPHLASWLVC